MWNLPSSSARMVNHCQVQYSMSSPMLESHGALSPCMWEGFRQNSWEGLCLLVQRFRFRAKDCVIIWLCLFTKAQSIVVITVLWNLGAQIEVKYVMWNLFSSLAVIARFSCFIWRGLSVMHSSSPMLEAHVNERARKAHIILPIIDIGNRTCANWG